MATTKGEGAPEIPTTETWRTEMRAARKRKKLTQVQLAEMVGISQPQLSDIENGVSGSSSYILEICRILGISPPIVTQDAQDARWMELGRVLRARNSEMYDLLFKQGQVAARMTSSGSVDGDEVPEND